MDGTFVIVLMSASRQVLSSPWPQRKRPPDKPIKVLTAYNGCKVRNRQVNTIMVDTVRRSIFNTSVQNSGISGFGTRLDQRLRGGNNSVFTNPIVKVTGCGNEDAADRKRKVRTPPPVKGREHVCLQTDNESSDVCFGEQVIGKG